MFTALKPWMRILGLEPGDVLSQKGKAPSEDEHPAPVPGTTLGFLKRASLFGESLNYCKFVFHSAGSRRHFNNVN